MTARALRNLVGLATIAVPALLQDLGAREVGSLPQKSASWMRTGSGEVLRGDLQAGDAGLKTRLHERPLARARHRIKARAESTVSGRW